MATLSFQQAAQLKPTISFQEAQRMPGAGFTIVAKGSAPREATPQEVSQMQELPMQEATSAEPEISSGAAFGRAAIDRFVNNLLAIPSAVADATQVNPIATAGSLLRGEVPEPVVGSVPRITTQDVGAALNVVKEAPGMVAQGEFNVGERFQQGKQRAEQAAAQRAEQAPVATALGGVAGDVATIATGRAPFVRAAAAKRQAAQAAPEIVKNLDPGTRQLVERTLNSELFKRLARGLKRATETGLEGATLATLSDGDPVETAAFAAGGQMLGSFGLTLLPKTGKGLALFGGTVVGMTAMTRLLQEIIPGGSTGDLFKAGDIVFDKIKYGLILGAAGALAGAGRVNRGALADNLPVIADLITTIPRGAVVSFWNDWTRDPRVPALMKELETNPELLTPAERKELESVLLDENKSLSQTLDKMFLVKP